MRNRINYQHMTLKDRARLERLIFGVIAVIFTLVGGIAVGLMAYNA